MLTDLQIRNADRGVRKLYVGDKSGLYLFQHPKNGGQYWRLKYRIDGREHTMSGGVYPKITLAQAREWADAQRTLVDKKIDPRLPVKAAKIAAKLGEKNTFESVGRAWIAKQKDGWGELYANQTERRCEQYLFKAPLGPMPVADVQAKHIFDAVEKVEKAGHRPAAHRVLQIADSIMVYAVARGLITDAPRKMTKALAKKPKEKPHPMLPESELPEFLQKLDTLPEVTIRYALKILLLTAVRSNELLGATWGEIDLDAARWTIPAIRMKKVKGETRAPHVVPLSRQAVALLRELSDTQPSPPNATAKVLAGRLVFPSPVRTGRYSRAVLRRALDRLGYTGLQSPHGFRSLFSTAMNEREANSDAVEHCLAHCTAGVRGRYNRASYVAPRSVVLQSWADILDALRKKATK